MIDEQQEETASLYVFGLLEAGEARAFEQLMDRDSELATLVRELRETAAQVSRGASPRVPPAHLEAKIFEEIREDRKVVPFSRPNTWLPWALAAGLALSCALLVGDRERTKKIVQELQSRDVFAQTQIATLTSKLESAPRATAIVLWDSEKQQGVLKVLDVPPTAADRDYQLWVVDPKYKQPVSAGVFGVDQSGVTKISFKPDSPVSSVKAFAVSLERKGGVPKAEGPMVLVSN